MFKIKYSVGTQDKFNRSTREALELVLSDLDDVNINDVFDAIGEMIDSSYEQLIDKNSQLFGFGYSEEVIITISYLTNNYVELKLHY